MTQETGPNSAPQTLALYGRAKMSYAQKQNHSNELFLCPTNVQIYETILLNHEINGYWYIQDKYFHPQ